jgi:activating signal cointegrator 1
MPGMLCAPGKQPTGGRVKALSLTQPWATAIAVGIKQWETRSWPTSVRGEIAIHAAKGYPRWAKNFTKEEQDAGRLPHGDLPLGAIVCLAELVECRQAQTAAQEIGEIEKMYGDYAEGRFAFKLVNIRPLVKPVLWRGALGFWSVEWDLHRLISEQLKRTTTEVR